MNREASNLRVILLKSLLIQITVTIISVFIFATIMYLSELDFSYSAFLGTLCVSSGVFATSFYLGKTAKKKGAMIGLVYSLIIFFIVTIISLFVSGGFTLNSLFHFLIYVMSGLTGGVLAMNQNQKIKFYK